MLKITLGAKVAKLMGIGTKKCLKTEMKVKQRMIMPSELASEEVTTHCNSHDKIRNVKALIHFSKIERVLKDYGVLANH